MEANGYTRNGAAVRIALAICACFAAGCAPWQLPSPAVTTVGQPVGLPPLSVQAPAVYPPPLAVAAPPVQTIRARSVPAPAPANALGAISIAPQTVVAPVNSELAMIASATGPDGRLQTGRRVEWTL